jgi:hypothetical protein
MRAASDAARRGAPSAFADAAAGAGEISMSQHKFRVGQAVEFSPDPGVDRLSRGRYTIVRLLPLEGNTPQYRIKNATDGHERMVRESQLGTL